jgi:hypothetical protein
MNLAEVTQLVKAKQNDRGIAHWKKLKATGGLKSVGVGLTQRHIHI